MKTVVEKEGARLRGRTRAAPGSALRSVLLKLGDEPGFIPELNDLLAHTPVDLRTVTSAVRRHPALSAQVIRFCNSSLSPAERVLTIEEAVVLLGIERLRTVVLGCHFQEYAGNRVPGATLKVFWQHSYAAAVLSQAIARTTGFEHSEIAYLAGMVHDVGVLPLLRDPAIRRSTGPPTDDNWLEAERSRYNTDHCELGAILAAGWRFPDEVLGAIKRHHEPRPARFGNLAGIVAAADRFCRLRGLFPCFRSEGSASYRQPAERMLATCLPSLEPEQITGLFNAIDVQFLQFVLRAEFEGWPTVT